MPRLSSTLLALALVLSPLGCDPTTDAPVEEGDPSVGKARADVLAFADSYEGRLEEALGRASAAELSAEGAKDVAALDGLVLADKPERLRGVPEGVKVEPLLSDPALRDALLGPDESAVVELLKARGVKGLLLSRDIAASIDRDRRVLSRLLHHDYLELFRLERVSDGLLYYSVHDRPVLFPPQVAALSTRYIRARLQGMRVEGMPKLESDTGEWTMVATLRGQGQELAMAFARDVSLQDTLDELVEDLEIAHRRKVELLGFPRLSQHIGDLEIEVQRVTERAYVETRDQVFLEELWEMGVDGAFIMTADRKERGFLPGSVSYTRNLTSADKFLREAAEQGGMSERRPWRGEGAWLELFRTTHYREHGDEGLVFLYRGVPPVPKSSVTLGSTREAILSSGDWWLANMDPQGRLNYKFWPHENRYSADYNLVRHTLATWNLVQAYRIDPERDPRYLEGARRALDFTNRFLKEEGEMSYYEFADNVKLGTVVVSMMGLIDMARETGSKEHDELIRRLARFALYMQQESGTFLGYHVPEGHPYHGKSNDIVPGEAALALVMAADYFGEDEWVATLPKFFEYYEPWFRSRAEKRHDDRPWPRYTYDNDVRLELVQFGPWTVMAANAYHRRTGDERVGAFGLEVARWMIEAYMYDEDRSPFPDYMGGYFKLPTELPAMQAFCYAEGTAAAYDLARRMGREEDRAFFEERTRESVRFGLTMQYDDLDTYAFSREELLWGGVRYAMNEVKTRVDYTYHAQSAMVQYYDAALLDEKLPAEVRDGPAGRPRPRKLLESRAASEGFAMPGSDKLPTGEDDEGGPEE